MVEIASGMHQTMIMINVLLFIPQNWNDDYSSYFNIFLGVPNRRKTLDMILFTKPHENRTSHDPKAIQGKLVTLEANYFALRSRMNSSQWKIYKYHVTFEPECVMKRLQIFLLAQHKQVIGGYLFDGAQLFTTRNLHGENNTVLFKSETRDRNEYSVKMMFTRIVSMTDRESLQVLNLIHRRNMGGLNLQVVGRNYYDPQNMVSFSSLFFYNF